MFPKASRLILSALLLAVLGVQAAPPVISVVKEASDGKEPVSIEISGSGTAAGLFIQTLKNDLVSSGWFTAGGVNKYADFKITGTAQGDSSFLRTAVRASWSGGSLNWSETSSDLRAARWQAHRFSDAIVERFKGRGGMAASRIAFIGKTDGSDVFLCDADGAGLIRLTSDRVPCLSPYWHPNGLFIFYTSFLKKYACVYRVPAAGGTRHALASFPGLNTGGAVSPDGKLIAVILSHPGNPELYVLNLTTRKATRLTRTPSSVEASPCWSPDGKQTAYVSDVTGSPQVYVMESSTGQSRRVSFGGSQNVAPSWGPDGRLVFCSKRSGYQIAVYDPADGRTVVISSGPDHEDPSWAPDGRHVICSRSEGRGRHSLVVLDTMGDPPVRLPIKIGDCRAPEWSPRIAQ